MFLRNVIIINYDVVFEVVGLESFYFFFISISFNNGGIYLCKIC